MGKSKKIKIGVRDDVDLKTEPVKKDGQSLSSPPPKKKRGRPAKDKAQANQQLAGSSQTAKRPKPSSSSVLVGSLLPPSLSINTFPKAASAFVVKRAPIPSTSSTAAASASTSKAPIKVPAAVVEMDTAPIPIYVPPAMTKAMSNAEILSTVFKHVSSANEFKEYRLVNRLWRDESLQSWRKCAKVRVYIRDRLNGPTSMIKTVTPNNVALEDLVAYQGNYFYKLREFPFRCYKMIEAVKFPLDPEKLEELSFWKEVGPLMKYLQFTSVVFPAERVLEGLQDLLLTYCPNLLEIDMNPHIPTIDWINIRNKTLLQEMKEVLKENLKLKSWTLDRGNLTSSKTKNYHQVFEENKELCRETLKMLPNLQVLNVRNYKMGGEFIDSLNYPTVSSQPFINLRVLEIREQLKPSEVRHLHNYMELAHPPLESLKIEISTADAKKAPGHFGAAMKLAGDTLLALDLKVTSTFISESTGYLKMKTLPFFHALNGCHFQKMTSLKIEIPFYTTVKDFIPLDFQCLWGMPSLKKLSYSGGDLVSPPKTNVLSPKSLKDKKTSPPLQNLEVFHYQSEFSEECLQLLGRWMPNVTVLEMPLKDKSAAVAFKSFGKVDEVITSRKNLFLDDGKGKRICVPQNTVLKRPSLIK